MPRSSVSFLAAAACLALVYPAQVRAGSTGRIPLEKGWSLQSSAKVPATGDILSQPGFEADGWYAATVPTTVVAALTADGVYPDPYFGMNLRQIPGADYPIGKNFSNLPMPEGSPFKVSWWYRTEFSLPASLAGRTVFLHFKGINYRANVWLNGRRVASSKDVAGMFRRYEFDVTGFARPGSRNALAVEVFAPGPKDLGITWVDWNPAPPDKDMGLWGDVYLTATGPIALRYPHVVSKLDLPSLDAARLTVTAEAWNTTDQPVSGVVRGAIADVQFAKRVKLAPKEHASLRFTPAEVPGLEIRKPRLWWPYRWGPQNLYTLAMDVDVDGAISDRQELRFGIQQMDMEHTPEGYALFKVNGKPILIRGGGWASDMMLRPKSPERLGAEMRYVKEMGLNAIRLEGKLETDAFYEAADREGVLIMPGWCCCDHWEHWKDWDAEDHQVAMACQRDQILRLRNHPSVFVWLDGSDNPPPKDVEQGYLDILKDLDWSKPVLPNATDQPGPVSGPSGVKMRGPYDYIPPSYWLTDTKHGGAFGFDTEVGPGAAVPPVESLKAMLPPDHLWPIDDVWNYHAGGGEFANLDLFTAALTGRYGKATGVLDYTRKAQALAYEGERAMFEAFGRNKYKATGVIQWMLNDAWPSMIWHLYDYYLRPAGAYFGSKKACEPIHVQYSYDDRSVAVVNDLQQGFQGLKVTAEVLNLDLKQKFSKQASLDVGPDGVARAFLIPELKGLSTTYFLRLGLEDSSGRQVSSNFYWLSTKDDVIDWKQTEWWYTPTRRHADLTALAHLPATTLAVTTRFESGLPEGAAHVSVANTGKSLAFQVRLKLVDAAGAEVLPVYWEDNYFELLPGEKREVAVSYPLAGHEAPFSVSAEAWNATSGGR